MMYKFLSWTIAIGTTFFAFALAAWFWLGYNLTAPLPSWNPEIVREYLFGWRLLLAWSLLSLLCGIIHLGWGGYLLLHQENRQSLRLSGITLVSLIIVWILSLALEPTKPLDFYIRPYS